MASLFDRRLLVVTGKGGVGKSTVAAALAVAASRKGKKVLVCEVNTKERISALLGAPPVGPEIGRVWENVDAVDVAPVEAMREYALMRLKFKAIYNAVFENRFVRYFLRAIPSLAELVLLGKVLYHVNEEDRGRPRWDLVILDAPATGHGITMLRLPQTLLDTIPPGPMAEDVRMMHNTLTHKTLTAAVLVTLPEWMPVNETVDLHRAVRDVIGMPRAAVVLNGYLSPNFSPEEREKLHHPPAGLEPVAQAALAREQRAELAEKCREKLRVDIDLPQITIPFMFTPTFGREAIEQIATLLEKS